MIKKLILLTCSTLLLTGCALKNTYADLSYKVSPPKSKLSLGKNLSLQVLDNRDKEDVGYRQNILGMKTARILPKNKIASVVQKSLEKAFLSKGITVAPSNLTLLITINKCFTDYNPGIFYQRAIANLSLTMHLSNSEGVSLYSKKIETQGIESPVFLYSGKNASKAIRKALQKALEECLNDELFLKKL
jgi:uncharacterized lipoprotein YajG